jgi:hypothetical protein
MSVARSELAAGDLSVPDTGSCEEEAKVLAMSD